MPLEISAGAGMEAIIFGTFGVKMEGKTITFQPINNEDIGEAQLKNIKYRGKNYGVKLQKKTFSVYEDDTLIATKFYGESITINL
jgi:trehalose/maltose hydrolase-like predicted phosphorylase